MCDLYLVHCDGLRQLAERMQLNNEYIRLFPPPQTLENCASTRTKTPANKEWWHQTYFFFYPSTTTESIWYTTRYRAADTLRLRDSQTEPWDDPFNMASREEHSRKCYKIHKVHQIKFQWMKSCITFSLDPSYRLNTYRICHFIKSK